MGEANDSARAMIRELLGRDPIVSIGADGRMRLRLTGDVELTAPMALWSEAAAFQHDDGSLTVRWANQSVRLFPGGRHWRAEKPEVSD